MRTATGLICVFMLAAGACEPGPASEHAAASEEAASLGTLQMALTGVDAQQQQYRLRAATFDIHGVSFADSAPVLVSLSSESDPERATLRAHLLYGNYDISLRPDTWYLERLTLSGAERVEEAVLLSAQTQYVYVQQGAVSSLAFQFGVDGQLVDFFGGDLEIGIGIQRAPDAGGASEPAQ